MQFKVGQTFRYKSMDAETTVKIIKCFYNFDYYELHFFNGKNFKEIINYNSDGEVLNIWLKHDILKLIKEPDVDIVCKNKKV